MSWEGAVLSGAPPASSRACSDACFQDRLRNQPGHLFWKLHTTPAVALMTGLDICPGPHLPPAHPPRCCWSWCSQSAASESPALLKPPRTLACILLKSTSGYNKPHPRSQLPSSAAPSSHCVMVRMTRGSPSSP